MVKKRQSQPVSALDVAAYILGNHCKNNNPILAWKMHKLVYLCQVQQLINEGIPMFYEKILATPKGVVIKELCALHLNQWYIGDYSKGNLNHLSLKQADAIAEVMRKHGEKTTEALDELIQASPSWKKALQTMSRSSEVTLDILPEDLS